MTYEAPLYFGDQFRRGELEEKALAFEGVIEAAERPKLPVNVEKLRLDGRRQGLRGGSSCHGELDTVEYG